MIFFFKGGPSVGARVFKLLSLSNNRFGKRCFLSHLIYLDMIRFW